MAGLRKLRGKYYARINYAENGKRKEKLIPLYTKQRPKAEKLLKEIESREMGFKMGFLGADKLNVSVNPNIQPLIDDFTENLKLHGRSKKTRDLYDLSLAAFSDIFKGKDINLITQQDYSNFMLEMKTKYTNINTLNIRLRNIRAFLNWLVETEHLEKLPFKIKQLQVSRKRPRYFTDAEMQKIFKKIKKHPELYARVYTHWKTGLRLRELKSSYYENGYIKTFNPVKNGIEREIPVDTETMKYYDTAKHGTTLDGSISRAFLKVIKKLKLNVTQAGDNRCFHTLRHTFAVRTYFFTRDIYRVKTLLGHSSVTTTEIYANFDLRMLEKDFSNHKPDTEKDEKRIPEKDAELHSKPQQSQHIKKQIPVDQDTAMWKHYPDTGAYCR